jgi:Tol biopolymer transport system component
MKTLVTICAAIVLLGYNYATAGTWTTPQPVEGVVNTGEAESTPFLSSDGLTLYFNRDTDHAGTYQAKRSTPSGPFTSVEEITAIGSGTFGPWVSPDNLRMYYSGPGWNINMSQRNSTSDEWTMGTGISELNALGMVCYPTLTEDELTMVFVGGNPTGNAQGADLYMASRPNKNSPFEDVFALNNLNTNFADNEPDISPDGLNLYFGSNRNGNGEIFQSTRDSINDPFGTPNHLSVFDIPNGNLAGPSLSSDGTALYYTCAFPNGDRDIYVSYNVPEPASLLLLGLGAFSLPRKINNKKS